MKAATVIIDPLVKRPDGKHWSHITGFPLQYLHDFAQSIGLKREWFQDKPGRPHYDCQRRIRGLAIEKGAIEVTTKALITFQIDHYQPTN